MPFLIWVLELLFLYIVPLPEMIDLASFLQNTDIIKLNKIYPLEIIYVVMEWRV